MRLRTNTAGLPALAMILALGSAGAPGRICAQAPQPADTAAKNPGRTAILLFMSRVQQTVVPLEPAQIRHACTTGLTEHLQSLGHDVVDPAELHPLMLHWRVRGDLAITEGFLHACRDKLGTRQLIIAHLLIGPRQITFLCRALATPWGILTDVRTAVTGLPAAGKDGAEPSGTDWLDCLGNLCRTPDIPPASAAVGTARNLVIFPTAGIDCDRATADMATQALLGVLLEHQPLPIVDPGYAVATLLGAGIAPHELGASGRALLADRFHATTVLNSELISYTLAGAGAPSPAAVSDDGAVGEDPLAAFALTLRETDLATGSIAEDSSVFRDHTDRAGWFGRLREDSLVDHLTEAVQALWLNLHREPKES